MTKRKRKPNMPQQVKAWGGFCDGKLHSEPLPGTTARALAVFRTKLDAQSEYQDVRRVEIRVIPKRKEK